MKSITLLITLFLFFVVVAAELDNIERAVINGEWINAEANLLGLDKSQNETLAKRDVSAKITFYTGSDLKNAACYDRNGIPPYNARDSDMIGAMNMRSFSMCFKCLEIKRNGKSIIVKIIDKCAGCPKFGPNVDLTKTAFRKLANLNDGRVGVKWRALRRCPSHGRFPTLERHH